MIVVREFVDEDWQSFVNVHYSENWDYGDDNQQRSFLEEEYLNFRKIVALGNAHRFGAFLDNMLVADLGVIIKDGIVRFDSVVTHRDYRKLGICRTLMYKVCASLLQQQVITKLVIEADQNHFAKDIYKSIGFKKIEEIVRLEKQK